MSVRLSKAASAARFAALGALIRTVEIHEGKRPDDVNMMTEQRPLAVVSGASLKVDASEQGFTLSGLEVACAARKGLASWFRGLDAQGNPVLDGVVGKADPKRQAPADMLMDDIQIWEGMEVEIPEFSYRVKARLVAAT